jgi:pimeloyl-ACP methyl ester carboxylesterase
MTMLESATQRVVRLKNCQVAYMRAGSGPVLFFLHDGYGERRWEPFMAGLAERYDVIVPDHPGFGRSEIPDWLDNIHDLAYFYLDFFAALDLRDVHLVGHAFGGWLACEIAVRDAAALATLTLVAPSGLRVPGLRKRDVFLMTREAIVAESFHDPAVASAILAVPRSDDDVDVEIKNAAMYARLAWQPRLYDPHLAKWLDRIATPTMLLWGDDDRIIQPAYADEFARLIPASRVETIRDCGHVPQIETPAVFVRAITNFHQSAAGAARPA